MEPTPPPCVIPQCLNQSTHVWVHRHCFVSITYALCDAHTASDVMEMEDELDARDSDQEPA